VASNDFFVHSSDALMSLDMKNQLLSKNIYFSVYKRNWFFHWVCKTITTGSFSSIIYIFSMYRDLMIWYLGEVDSCYRLTARAIFLEV
jgi:hypothetical protein